MGDQATALPDYTALRALANSGLDTPTRVFANELINAFMEIADLRREVRELRASLQGDGR